MVVEVVQHEILEEPVTIYNFEVEDFHTYYVGAQSVLVHNMGCGPDKIINRDSGGNLRSTADFFTDIELRNDRYYADKVTIDEIGRIEARGEDFSRLKRSKVSSRPSTEGGFSIVYKYSDDLGTKYVIHEVTDANGYVVHRDFDAVRISSGQLIHKKS